MPAASDERERIERALVEITRAGLRSKPRRRRGRAHGPRPVTVHVLDAPLASQPPKPPVASVTTGPGDAEPQTQTREESVTPQELDDLRRHLLRVEGALARLTELAESVVEAEPASREVFSEWVRMRRWEEIPFAEFLKLKRAGRI